MVLNNTVLLGIDVCAVIFVHQLKNIIKIKCDVCVANFFYSESLDENTTHVEEFMSINVRFQSKFREWNNLFPPKYCTKNTKIDSKMMTKFETRDGKISDLYNIWRKNCARVLETQVAVQPFDFSLMWW